MRKCPFCSEEIQDEAKKCRFCWEWLYVSTKEELNSDNNEKVRIFKNMSYIFALSWILFLLFWVISWVYEYNTSSGIFLIFSSISILFSFWFFLKYKWRSLFNLLWLVFWILWILIIFSLKNKN